MQRLTMPLAVLALVALPSFAAAGEGCGWKHLEQSASQCSDGQVYDSSTRSCVSQANS